MIAQRHLLSCFALALALVAPASAGQIVVDFDGLNYSNPYDPGSNFPKGPVPGTGSYNNGWDLNGGFMSQGVFFSNSYNTTFHSWGGWAYSDVNDPTKTGPSPYKDDYKHQYASITGGAPSGTGNYGISSGSGAIINLPENTSPISFQVTNTTYSYLAMTLGDGFARKFTKGDYFELKIFGYTGLNGSGTQVGEVDFFLANYTSPDSLPVDVWTLVDLSKLGGARSLTFDYASSDVGQFGINTPLTFAMDNLILGISSVPEPPAAVLALIAAGLCGSVASIRLRR